MLNLERCIDNLIEDGVLEHIAVRIGKNDTVLYDTYRGNVDENTLFDMASTTKIIATTSLALIALEKGLLNLDDRVDNFFPNDKCLTIKHLLIHTSGFDWCNLLNSGTSPEKVAETILSLPLAIPTDSNVLYSCFSFIILGLILEKVFEKPLDEAFNELVKVPLKLDSTSFLPDRRNPNIVNSNIAEDKRGIVNDCNCVFLGGVAGNAGLFSNIKDVTKYVKSLIDSGAPLINAETFKLASQNYTRELGESRGLGFLYVDSRYRQTAGLFSDGAIGHCGHTGQSIFVDCKTGFYVIILSDATAITEKKYGFDNYPEVIKMREKLHAAIKEDLKEN